MVERISGQLINRENNRPLSGLTVRILILDREGSLRVWGKDLSGKTGYFSIGSTKDINEISKDKHYLLHIIMDEYNFKLIERKQESVTDKEIRLGRLEFEISEKGLASLSSINKSLNLGLSKEFMDKLARLGFHTLGDVINVGGVANLEGLGLPEFDDRKYDDNLVKTLDAHADHRLVVSDYRVIQKLIEKGYLDPEMIANEDRNRFVNQMKEELGEIKAAFIYFAAIKQTEDLEKQGLK